MSKIALSPDASGTGTFTLASPNSNTNRTFTLPDAAGELLTTTGSGSGLTGIDTNPHKPVAVTGTTPSLDVGAYNYFRQTLTGDTTVSFASVPTDARWSYTFTPVLTSAYDLTSATTTIQKSFVVNPEDNAPQGLFFKPDGLKMYIVGMGSDEVNEYDLATAWDITTSTFLQLFSVAAQEIHPHALFFSSDGTFLYVIGEAGDDVNQYTLSTAWDISSAVYTRAFSVTSQESTPQGLFFKPDGLRMYITGSNGDEVNEYSLSTAWNVSTATYVRVFSVSAQEVVPTDLTFKPDGTGMFIIGSSGDDVNEYTLTTAWDISSASFTRLFAFGTETVPQAIVFKSDGSSIFILGEGNDTVREYLTSGIAALTLPSSIQNPPTETFLSTNTITYEFSTDDGGTNVYLINEEVI